MNYDEAKNLPVGYVMDAAVHKLFLKQNPQYPLLPFSTDNSAAIKILEFYAPFFSAAGGIDYKTGKRVFQFAIIWDIAQYQTYKGEGETLAEAICRAALRMA